MRIRSIRPEFWKGKKVRKLSPWARLLLLGLNNYCDDAGRGEWDEVIIKAELFPEDKIRIHKLLMELVAVQAIIKYSKGDHTYLTIPNWADLQHPNRPQESKLPSFTEEGVEVHGLSNEEALLYSRVGYSKGGDSKGESISFPHLIPKVEYVKLAQQQYDTLCEMWGKAEVDGTILGLDEFLHNNPRQRKTRDCNKTLHNWCRRESKKSRLAQARPILDAVIATQKPPPHIQDFLTKLIGLFNRWPLNEDNLGFWCKAMKTYNGWYTKDQCYRIYKAVVATNALEPDKKILASVKMDIHRS